MTKHNLIPNWIKPKIRRPALSEDYFPRPHLLNELNAKQDCPLALIVGPAGYGKTTLLNAWLNSMDWPVVWVLLDTNDNNLGVFMQYIVTAFQEQFPGSLKEIASLLQSISLPEESVLMSTLINELDQIETPFFLALDDYHLITEPAIHELLRQLLHYTPRSFHLALATRQDPPLPLSMLRAKGRMVEIRMADLRFNDKESEILLKQIAGVDLSPSSVALIVEQLDGWAVGLHLAGLSLQRKPSVLMIKSRELSNIDEVLEYLFDEVLLYQPKQVQEFLLRTSVLDELNQRMCEVVTGVENSHYGDEDCLDYLVKRNLFLSRTTSDEKAYRYHQLFQRLLQMELKKQHGNTEFALINANLSDWYARNDQPDDALRHALRSGDQTRAVRIISKFRNKLMNDDDWQRLGNWLSHLPREIINASADLVVVEALIAQHRFRMVECAERLQRAESLISEMDHSTEQQALQGEVSSLRAWQLFITGGNLAASREYAEQALELTPEDRWQARVYAWMFASACLLLDGKQSSAYELMQDSFAVEHEQGDGLKVRLLVALCFLHGYAGDLSGQQRAAGEVLKICSATGDAKSVSKWAVYLNWAYYHLGIAHYYHNELDAAEIALKKVVDQRYQSQVNCALQSMFALASTYQAQVRPSEAIKMADLAAQYALEMRSTTMLQVIKLFKMQLLLRQGKVADVIGALEHLTLPESLPPAPFFFIPYTTFAKVQLAVGTSEQLARAETTLAVLHAHAESQHNLREIIEVQALKALLADAHRDTRTASELLEQALLLAQPESHVRPFADLGVRMAQLLSGFRSRSVSSKFIQRILSAIEASAAAEDTHTQNGLLEPLTNRELDVLALLQKRMSSKEIGETLFISSGTAKRHIHVIYQKLDVHTRREAVIKALDLSLLTFK